MTTHEPRMLNGSPHSHAHRLLREAKYRKAIDDYRKLVRADPANAILGLELACALAGAGEIEEARSLLGPLGSDKLSRAEKSRYSTARAWIAARQGQQDEARGLLEEAVSAAPEFTPARVGLARFLAFAQRDFDQARIQLEAAAAVHGSDSVLALHRVAVELEAKDYKEASRIARDQMRDFGFSPRLWLAALLSRLAATPRQGFVAVILLGLLAFIPILGPSIYVCSTLLAVAYLVLLRRVSARFLAYPLTYWLAITGFYVGRVIFWGRAVP
ncbi:MAG TPA: tetratricopeptide repeat protein [Anaerolineales bacterium]|nr:tetratricopeptide repeat protein [Anaerolineales bacterium]